MSLAIVYSRAKNGIDAPQVTIEVHLSNGLPGLSIVGLPETAVKESKDRVRSAIINSHFEFPARRITVNLAPADLPKSGGRFDLPIALGILAASEQIPGAALADMEFIGELALSGALRPVTGALPTALACAATGRDLITPKTNGAEAALADGARVFAAEHLLQVCAHLNGSDTMATCTAGKNDIPNPAYPDLSDVIGQEQAKRALEIAAAGGHNLLFTGPPGAGKSMLASRLPGLLPAMTQADMLQSSAIYSVAGRGLRGNAYQPPFRSPHHSASAVAMVGGSSPPRPGEISLAHNGVLFLDELPEFPRKVLEVLREPLETGEIHISRIQQQTRFPACFQLIGAMNPCPCGHAGTQRCRCTSDQVKRYRDKISGPLLDRIDLRVQVPAVDPGALLNRKADGDSSATVRARVMAARERQQQSCGTINARMTARQVSRHCLLDNQVQAFLQQASARLGLSARGVHRVLKVARTIADLEGSNQLKQPHLAEALSYRL